MTDASRLDAARLTNVLRESGAIGDGSVTAVAVTDSGAFNSSTVFVAATYHRAPSDLPDRLVVKRPSEAAWSRAAAVEEARFYRLVATMPDHPPVVPRCLAATDDTLVLADLSATHAAPVTRDDLLAARGVPERPALDAAVDALAALHAYWWRRDPPGLPAATWWGDPERFAAYSGRRRRAWAKVRTDVPPDLHPLYELVLGRHDALAHHLRGDRPLTLVHGDAYLSNFLVRPPAAVLLDWQDPSLDIGAIDLATMCATFWTRDQRRDHEDRALRRYHAALGRPDRSFDDLLHDYRIALADWLTVPLQDAADGSPPRYWLPKMRCLADAFHDHDAADLFR